MEKQEFSAIRVRLNLTQKSMAELLGRSLRAVQSFEQGWRRIPENVERQLLYLVFMKEMKGREFVPCWELKNCPDEKKKKCPAWEFNTGHLCWFINGTICQGEAHKGWNEKLDACRRCKVFDPMNECLQDIVSQGGNKNEK